MKRALAVLLTLASSAAADEVYLKGGGRLSGVIIERTERTLSMEVAPGRITLPMSRVERIVEGRSGLAAYREKAARLGPADVDGWLALARWAWDSGLQTQAREAFDHVLAVDPANETAHRALGDVLFGGQWMSPAESYRAQGLVEFEGEWITPEARAVIARERAEAAIAASARSEADARAREAEARARQAEADAQRAEAETSQGDGIPYYPWVLGGGGCGLGCGNEGGHVRPHRHSTEPPRGAAGHTPPAARPRPKRDAAPPPTSAPAPAHLGVREPSPAQPVGRNAR